MTAEKLRNSILQEAISGRLVPQDPNDEPAAALLQRIREEKARLVKDGKLKKKDLVETPITDDEKPFEIPSSWEWVKISNLVVLLSGRDLEPSHYNSVSEGIAYITGASCIREGHIIVNRWTKTPVVISKCGDLLISCKGTIGKIAINNIGDCHIARQIMAIRLICGELLYVRYFIETLTSELKRNAVSMIPGISREDILNSIIPLPPLAEQKRIVAKLEELLPIVEQYGKAQTELDELNAALPARLRQSILQEAVQGKLTSHDEKDDWAHNFKKQLPPLKIKSNPEWPTEFPFDLPESWEWCRVGDICDILNGYAFKSDKYVESGINVIRISNVQDGKIIDKDNKYVSLAMEKEIEDYMLQEGDLLMSLTGNVGRVGLLPKSMLPAALNQRVACLRLKDESIKPFLLWYLQSPVFRERCESSGHGMAQLNISTEWLKQEYIPLPPLPEQQRIVAKIEELFAEIDKLIK